MVDRARQRKPRRLKIRRGQTASRNKVHSVCRNRFNVGFGITADRAGPRLVRDQAAIQFCDGDRELAAPEVDSE